MGIGIYIGNAIGRKNNGSSWTPQIPVLFTTALSVTVVNLAVTYNSIIGDGYKWERSADGVNYSVIGTTPLGTKTYLDSTGLSAGTLYYYRARVYKGSKYSIYSEIVQETTFATLYYVKTAGNDANTGLSDDQAWATINKVNTSTFSKGDRILFNKGDIWRETLTIPSSGNSTGRIAFGAYGTGVKPIIDGSTVMSDWTAGDVSGIDKPISWWLFGETATPSMDASDNGNNLTWAGANIARSSIIHPPTETYSLSMPSNAESASISYADLSSNFPFKAATTGFTVGGWVYLAANAAGYQTFASFSDASARGWAFKISGTAGKPRVQVATNAGTITLEGGNTYSSAGWHHFAIRWNGVNRADAGANDELSFWEDGVKQVSVSTVTSVNLATIGDIVLLNSLSGSNCALNYAEWFTADVPYTDTQMQTIYNSGIVLQQINLWKATEAIQPWDIAFDGTLGTPVTSLALVNSDKKWFWVGNVLYVYSIGNPTATYTSPGIESYDREQAIYASDINYVTLDGLDLCKTKNITVFVSRWGATSTGWIIQNCTIHNNSIHASTASDGTQYGLGIKLSGTSNSVIQNNTVYNTDWTGIGIYNDWGAETVSNIKVNNNIIYNTGHAGIDAKSYNGTITGLNITKNKVYNSATSGIYFEAEADYALVSSIVSYNLVYNNGGGGLVSNNPEGALLNSNITVENNTFYNNGATGGIYGLLSGSTFRNNICFLNGIVHEILVNDLGGDANTMDYNLIYNPSAANLISWNGTSRTWANFKALDGQETHGINSDPLFVSTSDFHLQDGSSCINNGVDVGLTSDYAGNPIVGVPDIGAYEKQ